MFSHLTTLNNYYFASTYGDDSYNASTYNGAPTTGTSTPGAPNTGFFTSVIAGQNEMWLIPAILALAVIAGAVALGIKKFVRSRKS